METITRAFLSLPFTLQSYQITEGWMYSEHETSIHGFKNHHAIDFSLPRNSHVLAAADGIAISSYLYFLVKKEGRVVDYQGKPVGFGLGRFIQIYHPQNGLYTVYGHLEKINPQIPFFTPRKFADKLWPVGHKIKPNKLIADKKGLEVKTGDLIGYVGDSGLTWGYQDFPERPDPKKFPSWDETHLHFEVAQRHGSKWAKRLFDPFGIKGKTEDYPDSLKPDKPIGTQGPVLWIQNTDGSLKHSA